jgi:tape measure domain-containing protein
MARTLADVFVKLRGDPSQLGSDVDKAGTDAGRRLGDAITRGADGRLRDAKGKFVASIDQSVGAAAEEGGRKAASSVTKSMAGISFGGVIKQAAGFAAVLGVGGVAGEAVKLGITTAASLEQAQVGFSTLLGSGQKAKDFLSQLSAFAAATPFELHGLVDSSRLLLGVGVSSQQVIPMLTAFGDAAGAVGVGQDAFQRIMLATSQAISAGKFQTQDLNQITENGIPIWKLLAEATGKPVPELRKMAEHGQLLASTVLPTLQKQMEKDYGGAMARQSQTLAGVWSTLSDTVSIGLANALKPLVPILTDLLPKGATFLQVALTALTTSLSNFVGGLEGKGPTVAGFGGIINTIALGLRALVLAFRDGDVTSDGFVGVMERVGVAARGVTTAVQATVGWFRQHQTVTQALAVTVGVLVAGLGIYRATVGVINAVTKAWIAVQGALDAVLAANPIGLVVVAIAALVAGFILAYQHSATFRAIVQAALRDVAEAGRWMWETVLKPAFTALVGLWNNTLVPAALFLWHNVLEPAFRGIAAVATWLWNNILQPAFNGLVFVIRNFVVPTVLFLWKNVVEPAFQAIRLIIEVALVAVKIALGLVEAYIKFVVAPVFTWLWHNIIEPAWKGISGQIQLAWSIIHPILTFVGSVIEKEVAPAFKRGIDGIQKAWDALKEIAAVPVRFLVNTVIDKGIIGAWNWINKNLKVGSHIDPISPGFAGGGRLPGSPSAVDNMIARGPDGRMLGLATGEYVVNARQTAKHLPLLEAINHGMGGYAIGGLIGLITNPANWVKSFVGSTVAGSGPWADVVTGVGGALVDQAVSAVKGLFSAGLGGALGGLGSVFGGKAPSGALAQWIATAIAVTGVPATWIGPLNTLIQRESGGNPNSINLTDINAQHGDPSRGLMQTIGATFNAYRLPGLSSNIYDPVSNIVAGIRYILSRYGSIFNVQQANASLPPKGYALGGPIPTISMDTGYGVLQPGANVVLNGTGRQEPVAATGGTVRLDEYTIARLAQALLARPVMVGIQGPNDLGLSVAGVAP